MTVAIDTSVLVAAIIEGEASNQECRRLILDQTPTLYAHGISEAFNTLTGGRKGFRLAASVVSSLLENHFAPRLSVVTLSPAETLHSLRDAETRGVRGGAVFDYLHLMAARKAKAIRIFTLNVSNFTAIHRPGDPEIVHP